MQGHAQVLSAEAATAAATQLMNENKYPEAAEAFEKVVKDYPTSTSASDAQFRVGYLNYLLGNYDKSLTYLNKILLPPAPAELTEMGYALIPQVIAGKATKETNEAARKAGFESAITKFDEFLKKYPTSTQVETITYSRAVACFQIGKYDEAATSLRSNLKSFPNSESILDSQFLLALSLVTQGGLLAQETPNQVNAAANAKFDEAEKLLSDIVAKRVDIALLNDAQYQLGELLLNRAIFAPEDAQPDLYAKALVAYRAVLPKDGTVAAQQKRIDTFREHFDAARNAKNVMEMRRITALIDHETTKLAAVKEKGDLTISSQIKIGEIFFYQKAYDEARVLFRQAQTFAEDADQKKTLLYFLTLSYTQQVRKIASEGKKPLIDKAVENYTTFESTYKADPMGDNLPLTLGTLFLANDPATAVDYFQEGLKLYPKGRSTDDTYIAQANAFVTLKRYDEALATFKKFLTQKLKPEQAASAEFGIANVLKETGLELKDAAKIDEAIAQYRKVAAAYPQMGQYGEQSSFWTGQLALQPKGDFTAAITDFSAFLKAYPSSELVPTAKLNLGVAYAGKNDSANAMRIFKEVADEFPKSDAAPYTYFQRTNILAADHKTDEIIALMREFITRYPDHEKVFYAYDTIAQTQVGKVQLTDAIATYSEMAEKHPNDPQAPTALGSVVTLWIQQAGAQGPYFAMNEDQRAEWNKDLTQAISTGEKLLANYPDSPQGAAAIQNLLAAQRLFIKAKLKTDEDITKYFQELAGKFAAKPQTKSKILFTLASFTYEKDQVAALAQMTAAYDPSLVYASADIDLYGGALLDQGKTDESIRVYQKLADNFPNPDPAAPEKSPLDVQEAQSVAIYGLGKALQKQGDVAGAAEKFDTLKKLYPWSPKIMEANFGIAESLHQKKNDDQAIPLLVQIARSPSGSIELRANAMLLLSKIQEEKGDINPAIDQYLKIAMFFDTVSSAASEGLWRGGQLLEKQAATLPETAKNPKDPKEATKGGQLKKAIKAYKDITTKYPNSTHVAEAKARIAALEPAK
jgi:TolA-binding protein